MLGHSLGGRGGRPHSDHDLTHLEYNPHAKFQLPSFETVDLYSTLTEVQTAFEV